MIVISDASPIICLVHLNKLDLFQKLFDKIIIPNAVLQELLSARIVRQNFLIQYPFIFCKKVSDSTHVNELLTVIDLGEAEAIALSLKMKPDFLLIDEDKGRTIAIHKQIPKAC